MVDLIERDINEAKKLLKAVDKASHIFRYLALDTRCDAEVIKRSEAIYWSLLMYYNNIGEMLHTWEKELSDKEKE